MAMTKKEYAQKSREELYKEVKDFVFGFFENDDHVPAWKKPYRRVLSYNWLTSPKNEVKPYTFFNQCLLNDSGCFATFNQIMNLNDKADVESFLKTRNKDFLNINPFGHKSQKVVFMIRMEIPDKDLYGTPDYDKVKEAIKNKEKDPETYKKYLDEEMITLAPPHVEFFNVFNINDINNLPKSVYDEQMKRFENFNKMYCEKDIDKTLEEKGDLFIKSYLDAHPDITLLHSGINSPNYAYVPSIDEETEHTYRFLHLPYKESCVNLSSYYSIAAHEISHSTMVNDQERAKESKNFRLHKEAYAKEELIAELSACMIISCLGLGSDYSKNNSREYCTSWKTVIKDLKDSDVTYCFMQSQKAANEVIDTYEKALQQQQVQQEILKENISLTEKVLKAMNYIGGFECDIYELQQDWYRENECYHICDMPVAEYLARYQMQEIKKYANNPKIKDYIEGKYQEKVVNFEKKVAEPDPEEKKETKKKNKKKQLAL